MSEKRKGRKIHSEEHKKLLRERMKGNKIFSGKTHSLKHKEHMFKIMKGNTNGKRNLFSV
jgi:hypothetical protein